MLPGSSTIALCVTLAVHFHDGQFCWDGVTPYYSGHVLPVAMLAAEAGESEEVVATLILHDVLEDTTCTREILLLSGVPLSIVEAVEAMTKERRLSYRANLERARANPIANRAKHFDLRFNESNRAAGIPPASLLKRYQMGLALFAGN